MQLIKIVFAVLSVVLLVSCERDQCDPPFSIGANYGYGLNGNRIIETDPFNLNISVFTTSVAYLDNLKITLKMPPQVTPTQINSLGVLKEQAAGNYEWLVNVGPSKNISLLRLGLRSKTPWDDWNYPIEVNVEVDFRSTKTPCGNWLNGHYGKNILWSKKSFVDSGWVKTPKGMEHVDVSR